MKLTDIPQNIIEEAQRQHAILSKGIEKIYPEADEDGHDGLFKKLLKALQEKRPLKVKLGADPTAPDIHLGHAVVLQKMKDFQSCGHIAQFLIGDYTALIGDPSGRNKTRPPLTESEIQANAKTYMEQVFRVVEKDDKVFELCRNSTWLAGLSFADTIKLCAQVTVAQIVQREDFSNRLSNNIPISLHELLYPIMQGYDSVAMECDIELGGTDQTFNCLMGRQLMQAREMTPQIVMTLPLLVGLDGKDKMSKSKGNYIGLTDEPNDMYGKCMSIPDELMPDYFKLLTDITDIPEHPMNAKKLLAKTFVTRFHDEAAAEAAAEDFTTRFSKREIPDELPEHTFQLSDEGIFLPALLTDLGFTTSNSEAARLIKQNAVKQDGEPLTDPKHTFTTPSTFVLQAGKRRMAKITLV